MVSGRSGVINVLDNDNRMLTKYDVPYGATLLLRDGAKVTKGELVYEWDPYNAVIVSEHGGTVQYVVCCSKKILTAEAKSIDVFDYGYAIMQRIPRHSIVSR